MRFSKLILIAAGVCLAQQAVAQVPNYNIDAYCERLFPESYQLSNHCKGSENNARRALQGESIPTSIMSYCRGIHPDSYDLLKHCIETEWTAKLNQPRTNSPVAAPHRAVTISPVANPGTVIIMRGDERSVQGR